MSDTTIIAYIKKIARNTYITRSSVSAIATGSAVWFINLDKRWTAHHKGIARYKGIPGRTNKKTIENSIIIEEINPGLNTQAIKESINMIENPDDYCISIGGDYGITCEEIDEEKLSDFLNTLNIDLILTGDLGASISKKLNIKYTYMKNCTDVYNLAIDNNKNLLFIYRSDYRKVSQRWVLQKIETFNIY